MKDNSLLNELEVKLKILVDNYKREKKKNIPTEELSMSHEKLVQIQQKVKGMLKIINKLDS
tara:strand:+ start:288 stop:470 length:183 start_codon:yes stop_codon:yes gene_type:complete